MLKPIQVTAADDAATEVTAPASNGSFTMQDFPFTMPSALPAGRTTYPVTNVGAQLHELNVLRLAPGTTAQDALAWDTAPAGAPAFEAVGGINGFSPDGSGYMTLDLQPGTYVAIYFKTCRTPPAAYRPNLNTLVVPSDWNSHVGMYK